jgi:hypothetical protein
MGIRLGIGLPGPFVATVGRRRRRGNSPLLGLFFLGLLIALAVVYWQIALVVIGAGVVAAVLLVRRRKMPIAKRRR